MEASLPHFLPVLGACCSGLDPVASHAPGTDTQGHTITEHLPCARHSVHMGEQGLCMMADLSGLVAQLAIVLPQSCWPVTCCCRKQGLRRQEGFALAIFLAPDQPSPRWRHAWSSWLRVISPPASNTGGASESSRDSSTCHIHERRLIRLPVSQVLCRVL